MNFKDSFGERIIIGDIVQIVGGANGRYFRAFPKIVDGDYYLVGESTDISEWVLDDVKMYEETLEWPDGDDIIKVVFRNGAEYNGGYIASNDQLKNFKLEKSIIIIEGQK
jgi:hypothetical protein